MKSMYRYAALLVLLTLVLTACGGGGSEASGDAQTGQALFAQSVIGSQAGCATCHSLEAGVTIVGPSMAGIGTIAGTRVAGMSAEDYLKESILEPDAYLVEGFPAGVMVQVWEEVLTEDQLNDLVGYLLTLK